MIGKYKDRIAKVGLPTSTKASYDHFTFVWLCCNYNLLVQLNLEMNFNLFNGTYSLVIVFRIAAQ